MDKLQKKQIVDVFCKSLNTDFQAYCIRHGMEENFDTFITYAIDFNFIPDSTIQHYAIQKTFEDLEQKKQMKKTEQVNELAHRFNLTARSIWNILRKKN